MVVLVTLGCALATVGCSPSGTEREARERARLQLEEKSRRVAEAANKAITGLNRKLGRKPPELDLGVSPATKTAAESPPERKP